VYDPFARRLSRPQPPAAPRLARAPSDGELSHSPESPNCRRHCEFLCRVATTLLSVHSVRPDICTMFGQSAIRHATSTNSTGIGPCMFECSLDGRPAADFSVAVIASRGDHAALSRFASTDITTPSLDNPGWKRVHEFARSWMDASSLLSQTVEEV
jgi:hypothetical protein